MKVVQRGAALWDTGAEDDKGFTVLARNLVANQPYLLGVRVLRTPGKHAVKLHATGEGTELDGFVNFSSENLDAALVFKTDSSSCSVGFRAPKVWWFEELLILCLGTVVTAVGRCTPTHLRAS